MQKGCDILRVEKTKDFLKILDTEVVKVTEMGNIVEIMYSEKKNNFSTIKMLGNREYVDLRTGEVKQCEKQEKRIDDVNEIRKTLKKLRSVINANVVDVQKCKFITLTYKENMTDTKKLYVDFKNFIKRLKYYFKKDGVNFEYIVACEPQRRGAWHMHAIIIFDKVVKYIDNKQLLKIWGYGFTSVKNIDNIDNVGAYLSAYLSNLDVSENDVKKNKKYIKGARLYMYPAKFNLYRCSRGIKKPDISYVLQKDAIKKVSSAKLTYESTVKITDETRNFFNTLNYKYYNKIKK